jgi:ribosomal protein S18 acetylase RimI-like enzyme
MAEPLVQVRKLRPDEAEAFRFIRLGALQQHPDAFGSTLEREAAEPLSVFADRLARNHVFGAFQGDALVGVVGFYALDGPKTRHKGILWGMYVKPAARGQGLAEALVECTIAQARCERVEVLELTVVSVNERALRFYRRMGFSAYGIEPRALKHHGTYFDEVLMILFLGDAAGAKACMA